MTTIRGRPDVRGDDSGPVGPRTAITDVSVAGYTFPTPQPESDGTLTWDATTVVAVSLRADGSTGLGWTYSSPAAAEVIRCHLAGIARGHDPFAPTAGWEQMHRAGRNFGTRGLYMQALSAVDIAWWDLKARLLDRPLATQFGQCREAVPIYGSGGFTSLTDRQFSEQVAWWHSVGCPAMKIKIGEAWGRRIDRDLHRVRRLVDLAGSRVQLMVDANGAYTTGQARRVGHALDELGVAWFEEPVSSDDLDGLAAVRAALNCDIAAGEYAADLYDVRALLPVVDCLQLDLTRCGGYTGWLRAAAVAQAHNLEVSAHCAPALHAPVAAAVPNLRHVEWFADHARIDAAFLTGAPDVSGGALHPDPHAAGHGLAFNPAAEQHRIA
jgi:L-alanine-DL-glutamate epimerase-like enolase superfamily enzyme